MGRLTPEDVCYISTPNYGYSDPALALLPVQTLSKWTPAASTDQLLPTRYPRNFRVLLSVIIQRPWSISVVFSSSPVSTLLFA